MSLRTLLVFVGASLGVAASIAHASAEDKKCPAGPAPIFEDDLKAAPSCAAAHKLHEACGWGSSGDAGLTGVVMEKCEALFLSRLNPAQKRNYQARLQRCSDKYAREQGSEAIAEAAMCKEQISFSFAQNADAAGRIQAAPLAPVKASFECKKARTPIEQLICSSDRIGDDDIDLSKAYKSAFNGASPEVRKVLIASENGWLAYVARSCISDTISADLSKLCGQTAFEDRIAQLPVCMAKSGEEQKACLNAYSAK